MLNYSDILRGLTDTIILAQLYKEDSYGYQINKTISDLSGKTLELKEATLYTSFRRLEESGLISSYWGDENSGARRRYYSITERGNDKAKMVVDVPPMLKPLIEKYRDK